MGHWTRVLLCLFRALFFSIQFVFLSIVPPSLPPSLLSSPSIITDGEQRSPRSSFLRQKYISVAEDVNAWCEKVERLRSNIGTSSPRGQRMAVPPPDPQGEPIEPDDPPNSCSVPIPPLRVPRGYVGGAQWRRLDDSVGPDRSVKEEGNRKDERDRRRRSQDQDKDKGRTRDGEEGKRVRFLPIPVPNPTSTSPPSPYGTSSRRAQTPPREQIRYPFPEPGRWSPSYQRRGETTSHSRRQRDEIPRNHLDPSLPPLGTAYHARCEEVPGDKPKADHETYPTRLSGERGPTPQDPPPRGPELGEVAADLFAPSGLSLRLKLGPAGNPTLIIKISISFSKGRLPRIRVRSRKPSRRSEKGKGG